MPSLADEKIGDAIIRIVSQRGLYRGCIIRSGVLGEILEEADLNALRARLRNEAGKLHPDYIGVEGAIARFRHFFPGGFDDRAFDLNERKYKEAAGEKLRNAVPLDRALTASGKDAVAVRPAFNTNVLSRFELARMHALLGSEQGPEFVRAAARFAKGDTAAGLTDMVRAIAPHGRHSWPMMTYLPNLWLPMKHMFLKPKSTKDYAQRIGHHYQYDYSADPSADVYEALLDLVATTETAISSLGPRSRIDVQSFIWIVGDYTEADLPLLDRLRSSG